MKKDFRLSIILSFIIIVLGSFYFYSSTTHKGVLEQEKDIRFSTQDSLKYYKYIYKGDSFFIIGDYEKAYENYRKVDRVFNKESLVKSRTSIEEEIKEKEKFFSHLQTLLSLSKKDLLDYKIKKNNETIHKDSTLANSQLETRKLAYENKNLKDSLFAIQQRLKSLSSSIGKIEIESYNGLKIYYAGDVTNGKANGKGYGLFSTGGIYEGEWKNNLRHGFGKYTWKDGSVYEGDFYGDKRQGKGTYFFASGEKYIGEWRDNERNGKGTMYDKDGAILVNGIWANDEVKSNEGTQH